MIFWVGYLQTLKLEMELVLELELQVLDFSYLKIYNHQIK